MIQRASRGTEEEGSKTNQSQRSQRVGSRENFKQRKIRRVEKYLVRWKGFTVEHDTWEREKDLGNAREAVGKFERRMSEIRKQEKLNRMEEKDFRREELPERYTMKTLYG